MDAPLVPDDSPPRPGPIRRTGSLIGVLFLSVVDLLALDDITTAGAWMPEILFVLVSIPALVVLGRDLLPRSGPGGLKRAAPADALATGPGPSPGSGLPPAGESPEAERPRPPA